MSPHRAHGQGAQGRGAHAAGAPAMRTELLELARHLREERLFVQHERASLQDLNERLRTASERLAHTAYVARQQRDNLDGLIFSQRGVDTSPAACCHRANTLEKTMFVDAYKQLSHQEVLYSEFLRGLREKPKFLATCLMAGDKLNLPQMSEVITAVFAGLYGGGIMAEDEKLVLRLLNHLMQLQLTTASNPRKFLRQGSSAFSRLYKAFTEELFSAKLFLTSALYEPILALLTDDEIFLDIDPAKAVVRFPPQERIKKFGAEGTPEFQKRIKEHREFIIGKLEVLTNHFISSIRGNIHSFPPSLARLLRSMYSLLTSSGRVESREVNAVCVDIIFDLFLCPAMVDPNPVGIIDMPISYIARSNLMQVAQILQGLALWKWEEIDPRFLDLYSRFDKEVMSSVLEAMLEAGNELPDVDNSAESIDASDLGETQSSRLSRMALLLTRSHIENLISFLKKLKEVGSSDVDQAQLESLVNDLPESLPAEKPSDGGLPSKHKADHVTRGKKQVLSTRLSNVANTMAAGAAAAVARGSNSIKRTIDGASDESSASSASLLNGLEESASAHGFRGPDVVLVIPISDNGDLDPPGFLSEDQVSARSHQANRVVRMNLASLNGSNGSDALGVDMDIEDAAGFLPGVVEKRTRFSLSHDEGSIGNTSDNLEAISEAASNHSVDSSLEDEGDQAEDPIIDNLSDMVSANVSGRGTPNVSGRDTPSSQVTEGEEVAARGGMAEAAAQPQEHEERAQQEHNPVPGAAGQDAGPAHPRDNQDRRGNNMGRKNGEPDLEEKFGRFEIKPPLRSVAVSSTGGMSHPPMSEHGDEGSLISDTWSTDVMASDTEMLGDSSLDGRRSTARQNVALEDLLQMDEDDAMGNRLLDDIAVPGPGAMSALNPVRGLVRGEGSSSGVNLDVSETASEAWSMDVLASDSESIRMADLDNEDSASVARSDDTRFTDDTTRSDEPLSDYGAGAASGGALSRRRDVTQARAGAASEGHLLRPSRAAAVEQWANQSRVSSASTTPHANVTSAGMSGAGRLASQLPRRGSDSSGIGVDGAKANSRRPHESSILKKAPSHSASRGSIPDDSGNGIAEHVQLSSHLSAASIASSSESGESSDVFAAKARSAAAAAAAASPDVKSLLDSDNPPTDAPAFPKKEESTVSTGAIPKSISFDKAVYENSDSQRKHTAKMAVGTGNLRGDKSFFKSWKLPKIGKGSAGRSLSLNHVSNVSSARLTEDAHNNSVPVDNTLVSIDDTSTPQADESSDDILAKYRKKEHQPEDQQLADLSSDALDAVNDADSSDERLFIDPANVESSFAFQDAKRKLRLMLSEADLANMYKLVSKKPSSLTSEQDANDLIWFLRVQLAEAHNLQDRNLMAQLHETMRCVSLFDAEGARLLLRSLRDDYKRRSPYLTYLVRCRQGLLATLSDQQRLLARMEVDKRVCSQYLISVCARLFLERTEREMQNFVLQFREQPVPDEKIALLDCFLSKLWSQMEADPGWMLAASEEQTRLARITIERAVISQVYMQAMYPNGDADMARDRVLSEHVSRLGRVITPSHRDLRIPRRYHYEQPWPSAQAEIRRLAAFKTASDKVACVVHCSQIIMNLLSLASSQNGGKSSVPAADDFVPVLVFVIIKANPPNLLSTVQYVESFYGSRLSGEDQYWWMQFAAAVEFIKTMDV